MRKVLVAMVALFALLPAASAQLGREHAPLFDLVVDQVGYDVVVPHPSEEGAYLVAYHAIAFWPNGQTFAQVEGYDVDQANHYFRETGIQICEREAIYNEGAVRRVENGRSIVSRGLVIFHRC